MLDELDMRAAGARGKQIVGTLPQQAAARGGAQAAPGA
jgi:hypothetical protein